MTWLWWQVKTPCPHQDGPCREFQQRVMEQTELEPLNLDSTFLDKCGRNFTFNQSQPEPLSVL